MSIANTLNRVTTFFSDVRAEMRKVTFPSREEVVGTTIVVIIASVIFAFFLWISDQVILAIYEFIIGLFS